MTSLSSLASTGTRKAAGAADVEGRVISPRELIFLRCAEVAGYLEQVDGGDVDGEADVAGQRRPLFLVVDLSR